MGRGGGWVGCWETAREGGRKKTVSCYTEFYGLFHHRATAVAYLSCAKRALTGAQRARAPGSFFTFSLFSIYFPNEKACVVDAEMADSCI